MRKEELISIAEVREMIQRKIAQAGSQSAWARQFGFEPSLVSNVMTGTRLPTKQILKALSLKKVVMYEFDS